MSSPLILGIESTCDETGIAFVKGGQLLADVTASSMEQHARYGGIIPEIASRAHLEAFLPTLEQAAQQAGVELSEVDAVACAAGPGLVGSLTVGISAAKAISLALGKPLYAVNHVIGHLAVDRLVNGDFDFPFIGLIVSGGHSNLVLVRDLATEVVELGGTLDDAAGEAFDKVGRMLHTPYPGGPHIDKLAQQGNRQAIRFPRGLAAGKDKQRHRYDFSFSGLKTAVARYVEGLEQRGQEVNRADIAAGFSEAVNDSLTAKAVQAALDYGCAQIVVGGGFSANTRLRELLSQRAQAAGIQVRIPPIRFCTDNGAQIAALGEVLVKANCPPSPVDFGPDSAMPLTQIYMRSQSPVQFRCLSGGTGESQASGSGQNDCDEPLLGRVWGNVNRSFEQMRPQLDRATQRLKPVVDSAEHALEKARPYATEALEKALPYAEEALEKAKPYAEQAFERAKPYAEQAFEKAKPYAEQAFEKGKNYAHQAGEKLHQKWQERTQNLDEPSVDVQPPRDVDPKSTSS